MPFNLFHKKKQPEQQTLIDQPEPNQPLQTTASEETPIEEPQPAASELAAPAQEQGTEATQEEPVPTESEQTAPTQEQTQEVPASQESTQEPAAETPASAAEEEPKPAEQPPKQEEQPQPAAEEPTSKIYLKAMPLKDLADVEKVKNEVLNGNIIILRITPLAGKSIEDVKTAVNELFTFTESIEGDIARLGEERVVICPKPVRIWREKTPVPAANKGPLPTAA